MFQRTFTLVLVAAAAGLVGLLALLPVDAQATASADRSFSSTTVAPGGELTVTINVANYGQAGGVTETLPAGFTYVSSSLANSKVRVSGNQVRFTLQPPDARFTYTVTASSTAGSYTFSGTLRDFARADHTVGGATSVEVSAAGNGNGAAQGSGVDATPGKTVTVTFNMGSQDRYRISTDSEGSGSFAFNGGQALRCADQATTGCDVDADAGEIGLRVAIDEDSPFGEIYVQRINRDSQGRVTVAQEVVVRVKRPNPPAALKGHGTPPPAALTANPQAGDKPATIGAQLVNARGTGIAGQSILVTTTRGVLTSDDVTAPNTCQTVSACTLTTQADGSVSVDLEGNGATGAAKVNLRHIASGLSHSATVTLHGPAASISAAVDQGTIGVGGSTFIVVTIVDADGNAAVGAQADVTSNKPLVPPITGPEVPAGSTANLVSTDLNVDRDFPGVANDVPACGDDPNGLTAGAGTNTAGKCSIQVTAPAGGPGPHDDATRGTHTITIGTANPRIPTVTVEVQVGGAPASMETDAPASVDSLSSTKITVTVLDDEGVRVGAVPISVAQVEGSGKVDDVAGGMTSDGRGAFTFLAPLSAGEVVFLVRAGDAAKGQQIQTSVTIAVGDPPAPESATWNNELVSGQNLVVWNGADGADASAGAADGVTAIWSYNTGSGSWDGYFPSAADVPGGNTLTSLSNGQAYVVIVE